MSGYWYILGGVGVVMADPDDGSILRINGVEIGPSVGIRTSALTGWRDGIQVRRDVIHIPGGPTALLGAASVDPRQVQLEMLVGNDSDGWNDRASRLDLLDSACGDIDDPITIVVGDRSLRQLTGLYNGRSATRIADASEAWAGVPLRVVLNLICEDPRWLAITESTISGISTTPVAIPAGTAESDWTLTISGGTNPVVTFRDHDGNTVYTMSFTAANTGETITIRGGKQHGLATTIDAYVNQPYSLLTGWDSATWPRLRPKHWDANAEDWMDIAITGGATGELVYRKAYRS